MSYIDDRITKEDFFDRIYRKSKSENSHHNAEIPIRNLELFSQHMYEKQMDQVIDDLIEIDNQRKTFSFFQKFIDWLGEDHPGVLYNPAPSHR